MKKISLCIVSAFIFSGSWLGAQNTQLANLNQDVAALQQQISQLRVDMEELARQNQQYKQTVTDLQNSNQTLNARIQELRQQVNAQATANDRRYDQLVSDVNASIDKIMKSISSGSTGSGTRGGSTSSFTFSDDFPKTGVEYIVEQGDTLGGIARKFNSTVRDIQNANKISDPRSLKIGQKLFIQQQN